MNNCKGSQTNMRHVECRIYRRPGQRKIYQETLKRSAKLIVLRKNQLCKTNTTPIEPKHSGAEAADSAALRRLAISHYKAPFKLTRLNWMLLDKY